MKRLTTEQFINKSNTIHGKKYEYGNCIYLRSIDKVSITCKLHGDFLQKPNGHLSGHGCPKCGGTDKLSTQSFINDSEKIHGNIYDYSKVNYINKHNKVSIICNIHGEFLQTPNNHLKNQGCPKCKGGVLINCDDFFLPELNILIEYNGYQHYYPVDYFGGIVTFNNIKNRDGIKREYCLNNNIELIIIKYDENIYDKLNKKLNKDYVMW